MARLRKHAVLEGLSGTVGRELVFKQYADKVVVSKYPDMSGIRATPLQVLQRSKLKEATAYASFALRDPDLRAKYERELKPGENVYQKAKKDYFEKLKNSSANE